MVGYAAVKLNKTPYESKPKKAFEKKTIIDAMFGMK